MSDLQIFEQSNKDFMAYKQLDDRKMGDVGIRNDEGTFD